MTTAVRICAAVVSARPGSVGACLDSLLAQTLPASAFRILVVADYSAPVLDHPGISWLLNAPRSIAAKRNLALRNAQAAIIAFTDDDCTAQPNWLQEGLSHLEAHPGETGVQGHIVVPSTGTDTGNLKEARRLGRPLYQTSNIFYRVEPLLAQGGFDERFAFQREDVEMGFRLVKYGFRIGICEKACVLHPVRRGEYWDLVKTAFRKRYDPLLVRLYPDLFRAHFGRILPGSFSLMLVLWALVITAALLPRFSFCGPALLLAAASVLAVRRSWPNWPGWTWMSATFAGYLIAPLVAAAVVAAGFVRFRGRP